MFKRTLPAKAHTPLFASDAYPEGKPKKKTDTLPKSLNSYEVIRDKVIQEAQPRVAKAQPKQAVKKKLLTD
jgi:hypothetical protein